MTAGYGLAGALSSGMTHAVAPDVYREVTAGDTVCCSASYQGAFERLEWSDAKVSQVVLRGSGGSNAPLLPDARGRRRGSARGVGRFCRYVRRSRAAGQLHHVRVPSCI